MQYPYSNKSELPDDLDTSSGRSILSILRFVAQVNLDIILYLATADLQEYLSLGTVTTHPKRFECRW